jgi:hypothetical protein
VFIDVNDRDCASILFVGEFFVQYLVEFQKGIFENLGIGAFPGNVSSQVVEKVK